jgi:hypothetical protein
MEVNLSQPYLADGSCGSFNAFSKRSTEVKKPKKPTEAAQFPVASIQI